MPRIYDSASNPLDFCSNCFPPEDEAEEEYGDESKTGSGPDRRGNCFGYNADHPPYEENDERCVTCHRPLTREDNSWS
jgi:hypothetical protein